MTEAPAEAAAFRRAVAAVRGDRPGRGAARRKARTVGSGLPGGRSARASPRTPADADAEGPVEKPAVDQRQRRGQWPAEPRRQRHRPRRVSSPPWGRRSIGRRLRPARGEARTRQVRCGRRRGRRTAGAQRRRRRLRPAPSGGVLAWQRRHRRRSRLVTRGPRSLGVRAPARTRGRGTGRARPVVAARVTVPRRPHALAEAPAEAVARRQRGSGGPRRVRQAGSARRRGEGGSGRGRQAVRRGGCPADRGDGRGPSRARQRGAGSGRGRRSANRRRRRPVLPPGEPSRGAARPRAGARVEFEAGRRQGVRDQGFGPRRSVAPTARR